MLTLVLSSHGGCFIACAYEFAFVENFSRAGIKLEKDLPVDLLG